MLFGSLLPLLPPLAPSFRDIVSFPSIIGEDQLPFLIRLAPVARRLLGLRRLFPAFCFLVECCP